MEYSLNGSWRLYFGKQTSSTGCNPSEIKNSSFTLIDAEVPGNVELDLMRAGYLPEDIYKGENILEVQKFEDYEWLYETSFETPLDIEGKGMILRFEGVDCLAEYWLNDEKIGTSKNMFVPIEIDVSEKLKNSEKNTLQVHLRSVMLETYNTECPMYSLANGWDSNFDSVNIRKAAHCFGWDIMPRALTSGIWRNVSLVERQDYEINQLFYHCRKVNEDEANIRFCYDLNMKPSDNMRVEIMGICGGSHFEVTSPMRFKAGFVDICVDKPRLWWPYGYGNSWLYDTDVKFYKDDKVVAQENIKVGIRTVKLDYSDITDGVNGYFNFYINGVRIMCKGSNWVPMDVFHSRDKQRYPKALEMFKDIGCNIIRSWGGNVYEDTEFFDFCDENGIMVWQDFSMACHPYPQNEEFLKEIREEATIIVKKLRNHPSIVLWAGDNECDQLILEQGTDPNKNRLTREVLPQVINENDVGRPYLASSPYISPKIYKEGSYDFIPEAHLWGPRDYFKSPYYAASKAHFISETGYHGCPSLDSLKKFIDEDSLWPMEKNDQWILHSSDQRNNDSRINLLPKQIKQLFGEVPSDLENFIFASQVSQAEANKFLIENMRIHKETKGGIIWWNLIDGWPQFSDAVVDYYYEKKIAYDYIKRSQQPFALMFSEIDNWNVSLVASNDTQTNIEGSYCVKNIDTNEVVLKGDFNVGKNINKYLGRVPVMYSEKGMFLIEWHIDNKRYYNHYLYGYPAFDLNQYKKWFAEIC